MFSISIEDVYLYMYVYTYIYLQVGKVSGTTYKKPCVVVVGIDDEFPIFTKITSVYIIDEVIVFSVLLLYTYLYNPHYYAFK